MKRTILLFILLISVSGFAQFSKTHYIPPISGSNNNSSSAQEQYIYISTPKTTPVKFKIIALGGAIINGTVTKSTPYVYNVGFGTNTQLHVQKSLVNAVLSNKGYIIEAEDLVYVAARIIAGSANQAGALVSKGLAALGTQFRIGSLLNTETASYTDNHYTFVSILATENNTSIQFSGINTGVVLINNAVAGNAPGTIILNSGQSFVMAVEGPTEPNRDGLIGSLVTSDKPIAVNCGSFAGSNASTNLDLGFDQIVSAERTGKEYIFIKSTGQAPVEKVLLVAHENNTQVFLNGSLTASNVLNAGDYLVLDGNTFSSFGNLYVKTSKNVFAYQTIGDNSRTDFANQELFFVPPLSCETPHIIDNIPLINLIGTRIFPISRITLVTETGSTVSFQINSIPYSIAALSALPGVNLVGPTAVVGNLNFVTYTITGLTGNISAYSSTQLYMAAYGTDGAATFGGFYSGFTFKPEVSFDLVDTSLSNCIPNTKLTVNTLSPFDVFQWYFNDVEIPGAINNSYTPLQPGYYYVKATISSCGTILYSDKIPVSSCPTNRDNDLVNDNIDIDNDNDGILNCNESYGNQNINISNPLSGIVTSGTYSNIFTGIITNSLAVTSTPFMGNLDGSFITDIPPGKGNFVTYNINFIQPINIDLEYVSTANATDLLNANADYIVNSDTNKTITILNPTNQLLIDTNFDGIYESGVTQFSSFEIRFRLNGNTPLAAGTGTFKFKSFQTSNINFTQKNLLDTAGNKSSFKFIATCIPNDTDSDGISNQLDIDSDNDGLLDTTEAQVNTGALITNTDTDFDGLDNAFEPGLTTIGTDSDGIVDYLDLDSDNDGIYDLEESGSSAADTNLDGTIDGNLLSFGANGLSNSVETAVDFGILNYSVSDTDTDAIKNYRELDSDGDLCTDVIEAGFLDLNNDGLLGNIPLTVNTNGLVTSGVGYTVPNSNYIISAPISISTQPFTVPTCEAQNTTISVIDNGGNTYQWQVSTDGITWTNLTNIAPYSGVTTNSLTISNLTNSLNNYKYRVQLNKIGNSCGLISSETTLTVLPKPIVNDVTIIQCDDDLDLLTFFNLTISNNLITTNYLNETFTYYLTLAGANTADATQLILNPLAFLNNSSPMQIWTRVENSNGCFNVASLNLIVSASQIPQSYNYIVPPVCDDELSNDLSNPQTPEINKRDGFTSFDLSIAIAAVESQLPPPLSNYTIKYYRNEADALSQNDINGNSLAIAPSEYTNFRNDLPNYQEIWVRVNNVLGACSGFGPFIKLTVEKLPFANPVTFLRVCDDDPNDALVNHVFDTSSLESTLLGTNQTFPVTVTYYSSNGNPLLDSTGNPIVSPFPATFLTTSQTVKARVTNNTAAACYDETNIIFTVDTTPRDFTIPIDLLNACDDEDNPNNQNGQYNFDTAQAINNAISEVQPVGIVIKYYDENNVQLSTPLPNPFSVTLTKNVKVVLENINNSSCYFSKIITFNVNPTPKINPLGNELVCSNNPTFLVDLDTEITDSTAITAYTYQWYLDNIILQGETNYSLQVNQEGVYTVEVTNSYGCTKTRTINVVASNIATIESVIVVDLVENNTVTIEVSGPGDYVYSIDEELWPYQESNIFYNINPGEHTVYVKDLNGCGIVSKIVLVLGVPKYFTPNGDGYNDYWNVQGVTLTFNAKTVIQIFDRYGKLIKQISPLNQGWDGTFNGTPLPSTDYWYNITFEDGRNIKGHFSLKR